MIKKIIRRILRIKFLNKFILNLDFKKDKIFFNKYYMYSKPITKEKIEYDMLFEIHKLEKAFSSKNPRPFGVEKVNRIINDITYFEKNGYEKSFSYNLSYSALEEYTKFYEKNNWIDRNEYCNVKNFLLNKKYDYILVGSFDYNKADFIDDAIIDYNKFISSRRSIRNFASKSLDNDHIKKAVEMAIKTPTACNRQMCKIYYVNSENGKKIVEDYAQGLGLFDLTNANYFVITFDVSANYMIGERNQGMFNAGLVTMNFINALHSLGIGTCPIQFGNSFKQEMEFKKLLNISKSERIAVIVTAGYYDDTSKIPYSSRKPIKEIFEER